MPATSCSTAATIPSSASELRQLEPFGGLGQSGLQPVERADHGLELGALAAEFLRTIWLAPDRGVLELSQDSVRRSLRPS